MAKKAKSTTTTRRKQVTKSKAGQLYPSRPRGVFLKNKNPHNMNIENIIASLEKSLHFLSLSENSEQVLDETLEDLKSLLYQAIEQAKQDDREGLLASLNQIDELEPKQFALTKEAREYL